MKKGLIKRSENYADWYLDVIEQADLAEHSPVKGCMIIKPYGYAIWERIQQFLDRRIKETGHTNAYFPVFVPKSFFTKEEKHASGFAKECAVVTHHRLKTDTASHEVVVDPESKLEEDLVVRPTSETIIYDAFSRWVKSWRDLPVLINQWCNVVRWELRTRFFLRTTEFLWQEGHTAHMTAQEADEEARKMLGVYKELVTGQLAIPVIEGKKSPSETFPGADYTYTLEAMMQDGKALQSGTSHMLGQNFAKAFNVQYADKDGKLQYVWQTSWGLTTRIIGALIMVHSDDEGLVLPSNIAPIQVVIVPIWGGKEEEKGKVFKAAESLKDSLLKAGMRVELDNREHLTPGFKFNEWEKKGVPVRIEIGPKELSQNEVMVVRRDTKEKELQKMSSIVESISNLLSLIQENLLSRAIKLFNDRLLTANTYEELKKAFSKEEGSDVFVKAPWCGDENCESKVKEETKATIRCIPLEEKEAEYVCVVCGKKATKKVIFAKAY